MDTLQRIDISASPGYPLVKRKIAVIARNEDYSGKSVTLICRIEHYDQDDHRLNAFAALERDPFYLVADDSSRVNPETGALVFPDETGNYPVVSVGQYTWLKTVVEGGANPFEITQGAVLEADSYGRFT